MGKLSHVTFCMMPALTLHKFRDLRLDYWVELTIAHPGLSTFKANLKTTTILRLEQTGEATNES